VERRKLLVLAAIFAFTFSGSAYQACQSTVRLDSGGGIDYNFQWTVSPGSGYYYPEDSEWGIYISEQAENLQVRDTSGDSLEYDFRNGNGLTRKLSMENDQRIEDEEEYTFNVSYELERGATVFGDRVYLNRNFHTFCPDSNIVFVGYPEEMEVVNISQEYSQGENGVMFQEPESGSIEIEFRAYRELSSRVTWHYRGFDIDAPSMYSEFIESQVSEVNSYQDGLEEKTGVESPGNLTLRFPDPQDSEIMRDSSGEYSDGEIKMSSELLSAPRLDSLETLTHEMVHAHNEKVRSPSDWWWEEGTAEHVTYSLLEENGYNTSGFRESSSKVEKTFEKCSFDREFIQDWSPVTSKAYQSPTCETQAGMIKDENQLGYAYSRVIIEQLEEKEPGTVYEVQSRLAERNLSFSDETRRRSNQLNFIASQAAEEDLTDFFNQRGITADSWQEPWSRLEEAGSNISKYQAHARHDVFWREEQRLDNMERSFYTGNYTGIQLELERIEESAAEVNESYYPVGEKYANVSLRLDVLESRQDPRFYTEEIQKLNQSRQLILERDFDEAESMLEETSSSIEERNREIQNYREGMTAVDQNIEGHTVMTSVFLDGASERLEESRQAYSRGNLSEARKKLDEARRKEESAFLKAAGAYTTIILLIVIVVKRRRITRLLGKQT
jgi:hypothetical protein